MIKKIFSLLLALIALMIFGLPLFADNSMNDDVKEHYRLGNIYYEHGLYDQAEAEFRKALPQNTQKVPATAAVIAPVTHSSEVSEVPIAVAGEYVAAVGDALSISVWENPDLTQEVTVRSDGKISFPLITEVDAAGKTLPQLSCEIANALSEYIKNPNVSIALKQMGGNKVIVMGEVNTPGVYKLSERKTVLEAIAMAGGFTRDAVDSSVIVIQGNLDNPKPQRINLAKALRGKVEYNLVLANQSIIFVPRKFIADLNYYVSKLVEPVTSAGSTNASLKSIK